MTAATADWIRELGLDEGGVLEFMRSRDEIASSERALPHANAMRRAWDEMKLDGILCQDGVPTVYFREVRRLLPETTRTLHRKLWNQSLAPLLVLIAPADVYIYSGLALPARPSEEIDDGNRLVNTLNRAADALELREFARNVETGEIFRRYQRSFDPLLRVDQYLLSNLDALRELLRKAQPQVLDLRSVHALIGRIVFTCYLSDREIIQEPYFAAAGAEGCKSLRDMFTAYEPPQAREILFRLFRKLQEDFNGDIFADDLDTEQRHITDDHLRALARFLNGDDLPTDQLSLGFWAYDFRVIPIETISSIYEQFLGAESAVQRKEIGGYYTPRFLAELVLDVAFAGEQDLLGKRFLDPSCGSGIFLVGIFNRLAEQWRRRHGTSGNAKRADALLAILRESIYGIDSNETACRIAAFSLYLALLDHLLPRDIQLLQERGRALPQFVAYRSVPDVASEARNITITDFFDENLPSAVSDTPFDFLIGNPPWARTVDADSAAWRWLRTRGIDVPQGQLACAFVLKALDHLRDGGTACLILPSSILLNIHGKALRFQARWLSASNLEQVVNFADLRHFLFSGARHPTTIVRYSKARPDLENAVIDYHVPKTDVESLRADLLSIAPNDRVELRLTDLLADLARGVAPRLWKRALWGTPRDLRFLDRLDDFARLEDRLVSDQIGSERWMLGEGFNKGGKGRPVERDILRELPFLPSSALGRYVVPHSALLSEPPTLAPRYLGKESIFRAPHVLFPRGVSETGARLNVAFCNFDCTFEHAIRGVHASPADEEALRALTCALASPLALYYFFHTSASWGSERPQIHVFEYRQFPFPLSETAEQKAALRTLAKLHRSVEVEFEKDADTGRDRIEQLQGEIDELVYSYYEVDDFERWLIEDTVHVSIPSATPRRVSRKPIPALDRAAGADRQEYLSALLEVLNQWARRGERSISGQVIESPESALAVIELRISESASTNTGNAISSNENLGRALDRIYRLATERAGSVQWLRNLKVFDRDRLYLVKPPPLRHWTRTAALNDADEIAASILMSRRRKGYGT